MRILLNNASGFVNQSLISNTKPHNLIKVFKRTGRCFNLAFRRIAIDKKNLLLKVNVHIVIAKNSFNAFVLKNVNMVGHRQIVRSENCVAHFMVFHGANRSFLKRRIFNRLFKSLLDNRIGNNNLITDRIVIRSAFLIAHRNRNTTLRIQTDRQSISDSLGFRKVNVHNFYLSFIYYNKYITGGMFCQVFFAVFAKKIFC